MKILSVENNSYYNSRKQSFGAISRGASSKNILKKSSFWRNDTYFFRDGKSFAKIVDFFVNNYKNTPKVNVYSYGCSDGSEPFSFLMRLLSTTDKETSSKFLPIIAKDFDKYVIDKLNAKDFYFIKSSEKKDINLYTNGSYERFFKEIEPVTDNCHGYAFATQELYDNVKFSIADIFKDYRTIEPENSIVFIRNFLPYIDKYQDRQELIKKLGEHLQKNSFIIIGNWDIGYTNGGICHQILESGFEMTNVEFVFKKNK